MNTRSSNGDELLHPLPLGDRIEEEMVIGVYPLSEEESIAAINLPSRENLLKGIGLMVPSIGGDQLTDPRLTKRIAKELAKLLGGWFAKDIAPYIQLYDSLVSQQLRDMYHLGGMAIQWDKPQSAFYYLAFQVDPSWVLQAVGELSIFHCISLGYPLSEAQAIQRGGHSSIRPLGPIEPFIAQAVPNIAQQRLTDHSEKHPINVFDAYFLGTGLTIKAGVRMRLREGKAESFGGMPYHYGIRINIDLRHS